MKKLHTLTGIAAFMAVAMTQAAVFYQSDFTGSTLASAGLTNVGGSGTGDWVLDGTNDRAGFDWLDRNARATLHTSSSFQSDGGFTLDVSFQQDSFNPSRFGFGLVDAAYTPSGDAGWLSQADSGAYGVGFTTSGTTANNAGGDVLAFNDGSTAKNNFGSITNLSTVQGDIAYNAPQTISFTVTATGWSYSLNDAAATAGTFVTAFDTSKSYQFVAYQQASSNTTPGGGENSYYSDIILTAVPEPSSAALLAGCFALTSIMLRRRR
jgi:hypothetical protein